MPPPTGGVPRSTTAWCVARQKPCWAALDCLLALLPGCPGLSASCVLVVSTHQHAPELGSARVCSCSVLLPLLRIADLHLQGPDIEVVPPADDRLRFVIDTTASYVLRDGPDFEQVAASRSP